MKAKTRKTIKVMGGRCMGGVWEVYGTCFTTPHVAPRPLYKGNAEDDVRSRRFFALSSPKNVYSTRAKFPRHKHQVCPREASCSQGGRAHLPCHKMLSSLPQDAIFLATNIYLPCHKRPSCVVQDHRRKNRETNSGEG